ncbi:hypothetical protein PMAYCL1PPCAC_24640, partial [Pristionchus mayeri]
FTRERGITGGMDSLLLLLNKGNSFPRGTLSAVWSPRITGHECLLSELVLDRCTVLDHVDNNDNSDDTTHEN